MVLGWVVLFVKLNKMIINPDEIFKRTLRKSQVFGRNSKIRMVMVFKIGRMFFIWRKGKKNILRTHAGGSSKSRARVWVGETIQYSDRDGRGNCAERHVLASLYWRKLKKVFGQNRACR